MNFEMKANYYGYGVFDDPDINLNRYSIKMLNSGGPMCSDTKKDFIDDDYAEFLKEILENKMGIIPNEYSVIITSCPIKNKDNIAKIGRILLEDMSFKSFAIVNSCSLSLFSTGRTSGLVVDCGEDRTYTTPIFEVLY